MSIDVVTVASRPPLLITYFRARAGAATPGRTSSRVVCAVITAKAITPRPRWAGICGSPPAHHRAPPGWSPEWSVRCRSGMPTSPPRRKRHCPRSERSEACPRAGRAGLRVCARRRFDAGSCAGRVPGARRARRIRQHQPESRWLHGHDGGGYCGANGGAAPRVGTGTIRGGRAARAAQYASSGIRSENDDYPWPEGVANGSTLSPQGYYFRECVDFVAWRFNRDAGASSTAPRWTWQNLTPGAGSARSWASAWASLGRVTTDTPVVGAAAWLL